MFAIPSAYRVIYIPVYFWIVCLAYLFITGAIFLKEKKPVSAYLKEGVRAAFFLHVYVLLGGLVGSLFKNPGLISGMYILYIKTVFLISTAVICMAAFRQIYPRERDDKTRPMIYVPFIASAVCYLFFFLALHHYKFSALVSVAMASGAVLGGKTLQPALDFLKKFFSRDSSVIMVVFIAAFLIRAAFGIILVQKTTCGPHGYDGYLYASDDGLTFDDTANRILRDPSMLMRGEVRIWGNWDQFYAVTLAVIYKIFGRNFYILAVFQSLLGASIPPLIFMIGRSIFSRAIGIIAAIALSFKGGLILLSAYMGHEAVWLPILYLLIFLLARYFKDPGASSVFNDAAIGLALGVLTLFRSVYLYLLPYLGLWELSFLRGVRMAKGFSRFVTVSLVCAGVIWGLLSVLNNQVQFLNSGKGQYLWRTSRLSPPFQYLGNERLEAIGISPFIDPKGSLRSIAEHPIRFLALAARIYPLRVVAYFEAYQFGLFDPIYMINPANIRNKFASTLEFYFTVFFLTGLIFCLFKRKALTSPVFLILTFHAVFFCGILSQQAPRLKETSSPLVYLIGSFGAYTAFNFLKRKEG